MSQTEFRYLVTAVNLAALYGHLLLPHYGFDPESGQWQHRRGQPHEPMRLHDLRYGWAGSSIRRAMRAYPRTRSRRRSSRRCAPSRPHGASSRSGGQQPAARRRIRTAALVRAARKTCSATSRASARANAASPTNRSTTACERTPRRSRRPTADPSQPGGERRLAERSPFAAHHAGRARPGLGGGGHAVRAGTGTGTGTGAGTDGPEPGQEPEPGCRNWRRRFLVGSVDRSDVLGRVHPRALGSARPREDARLRGVDPACARRCVGWPPTLRRRPG